MWLYSCKNMYWLSESLSRSLNLQRSVQCIFYLASYRLREKKVFYNESTKCSNGVITFCFQKNNPRNYVEDKLVSGKLDRETLDMKCFNQYMGIERGQIPKTFQAKSNNFRVTYPLKIYFH